MSAVIKIDQAGTPAGVAGFARDDGLATGVAVVLTSMGHSSSFRFRLLWVGLMPVADTNSVASLQQSGVDSYSFTPTANVFGSWLIELITDEGTASEDRSRKVWAVKESADAVRIPAPNEQGDPEATLFRNEAAQVVRTDFNQKEAAGPWIDGRTVSWWRELANLIFRVNQTALRFTAVKVANYSAVRGEHVLMAGAFNINLPAAASCPNARIGARAQSGAPTVVPAGADTIAGAANYALGTVGKSVVLQSDGVSVWYIVGYYPGGGV